MCSFEVSRGVLPHISIVSSKESLLEAKISQPGAKIFEVSIGLLPSFQSFHQKNPCYRSLMKIHQHGAKIFNKMCSFEVSRGVLPHISIVSSKESLLEAKISQPGAKIFEVSIGLLPSFQSFHQNNPCY